MADLDQTYGDLEQAHEHEYQPEHEAVHEYQPEHEAEHEYQHEHEAEHEYQPEHEAEHEHEHENENLNENENEAELVHELDHELAQVNELEEHDETEDGIPENSHPDEKQDNVEEPVAEGGEKWPGWPGESIFRMLVPAQKVGSIIGRKGEYIKKTCEETKARIKILDGPPGTRERAVNVGFLTKAARPVGILREWFIVTKVMVSAKEEPDVPIPPAVDGLLKIHKRVVDGLDNDSSHPPPGGKVSTRLLFPAAQAGSLIGKQGTTVKSIQEESNCVVRVLGAEDLPVFALQDDRIVEVVGEPADIHKAIELIATHLRKFLVDRSIVPIIEMQMQTPNPQRDHVPPPQHWGPPPQSFPPNAHAGPGYGANPHFMPPPSRQFDNYYPSSDMPPPEKQSHQGISAYGREAPMPASSVITQVTQQMQIPLAYADAVIGTQGASVSYIRRVSGATVTIQETRGVPTEMTVEIGGTATQVQTAQQLIQNFMAEAAASQSQTQQADQGYNSYGGSVYPSNPSQTGSVYGTNYGY